MRLWRLPRERYRALDGEGARRYGGRWNSEGIPVVYASSTLSLAALEYLVHVDIEDVPDDLVALEIEVPEGASREEIQPRDLPDDWNRPGQHPACVAAGDRWARAGDALLLDVPSALIPRERNVLINPLHPEAAGVHVRSVAPFAFDPRLIE
jgi:RES domain-containing protein